MRTFTKLFAIVGVALGALIFTDEVFALEAPDALIKRVSQEIIEIARSDKEIQAGNRQPATDIGIGGRKNCSASRFSACNGIDFGTLLA